MQKTQRVLEILEFGDGVWTGIKLKLHWNIYFVIRSILPLGLMFRWNITNVYYLFMQKLLHFMCIRVNHLVCFVSRRGLLDTRKNNHMWCFMSWPFKDDISIFLFLNFKCTILIKDYKAFDLISVNSFQDHLKLR